MISATLLAAMLLMANEREISFGNIGDIFGDGRRRTLRTDNPRWFEPPRRTPDTELQALMETPPGHEPEPVDVPSGLLDLLDELSDEDLDVLNAFVFERLSVREAATRFGVSKSTAARRRDRVFGVLRDLLAIEGEGNED